MISVLILTKNEEKDLPQTWPFDAHLLDTGWTRTRAAQVCPTQAIRTVFAEDAEMQKVVESEGLQVLHPEYGTRPRVWYRHLDRWFKAFVGGSVEGEIDGVTECVEGARVVLRRDGRQVAATRSDPYGEFKFAGLNENSGGYDIEVTDERFAPRTLQFELAASVYLGTISLGAATAARTAVA